MKSRLFCIVLAVACLSPQFAYAGALAYVPNYNGDSLSVIDAATHAELTTVPTGFGFLGVAALPNGSKVYIVNYRTDQVSVISTATNSVIKTFDVGARPYGAAALPNGSKVYVANIDGNSVSVISTATDSVIKTITPVGSGPIGVAAHPDGSRVYVTAVYSNEVYVIETVGDTVVKPIGVGFAPYGVAALPNGSKVYVANSESNSVSVIETVGDTVAHTITGLPGHPFNFPYGVAALPNGSKVYVTNYLGNDVSVIETVGDTVVKRTPTEGLSPIGVDVTPDGSEVYVANFAATYVSVIETAGDTFVTTVGVGPLPAAFGKFFITTSTPPTNPTGVGAADPSTVAAGDGTLLTVTVTPGTIPPSTGLAVTCDLTPIGGSATQAFSDDGTQGDATAGDNVFSYTATVGAATTGGAKNLACTITDAQSRSGNAAIGLTVYRRETTLCFTLTGLDTDLFAFEAVQGEKVTITLAKDAQGVSKGNVAGLYMTPFRNTYLLSDRGALPNRIEKTITFPGTYIVKVTNYFTFLDRFVGDYCVTLESDKDAYTTFRRW